MWNNGSGGSIEETNLWLLFKCQVVNQWLVYDSTNTFLFLWNEIAIIKLSSDKAEMTTFIAVFWHFLHRYLLDSGQFWPDALDPSVVISTYMMHNYSYPYQSWWKLLTVSQDMWSMILFGFDDRIDATNLCY